MQSISQDLQFPVRDLFYFHGVSYKHIGNTNNDLVWWNLDHSIFSSTQPAKPHVLTIIKYFKQVQNTFMVSEYVYKATVLLK